MQNAGSSPAGGFGDMGAEAPWSPMNCHQSHDARHHITAPPGADVARATCTACGTVRGYVGMDALMEVLGIETVLDGARPRLHVHVSAETLSALRTTDAP